MSKSYLLSFKDLFSFEENIDGYIYKIRKVLIPMIQRDYAQGRTNDNTTRIRNEFIDSLNRAIKGDGICLDFIYGDIEGDILTPLDGQQRLTTLFLLHYFAAKKEGIIISEYSFLTNFSYETRSSSREFCRKLLDFSFELNDKQISKQIKNERWFLYGWESDPTISSMLVMLDKIKESFYDINNLWDLLVNKKKIVFLFLPIFNMGLKDDIYIRMNSRGKPLTTFEHFKAQFERKVESIYPEKKDEINRKIDGKWTDFLWKYRRNDEVVDNLFLNFFRCICHIVGL